MSPYHDGEFEELTIEDAASLPGVPDEYQRLWTPHRLAYIRAGQTQGEESDAKECVFCVAPELDDEQSLIVHRGTLAYVVLNLYPYNAGHLLICPYRHVAMYDEATAEEVAEIGSLTQTAMRVIREHSGCQGFNIGMNQGKIAGAGVAEHLHQHLVPRWATDANFFPIVAKTKAVTSLLGDMRSALVAAWPQSN